MIAHDKPSDHARAWGAVLSATGTARFGVWAPGVGSLSLRLDGVERPMTGDSEGWFELAAAGVDHGTEYAYLLADGTLVPDPASRAQAAGVHGPSLVIDPVRYHWKDAGWNGRPWADAVIYELHVGTFTPEGTFRAAAERLMHLSELGVTAIEIMPVAQFAGDRGWGYDGVLLYAPHQAYGTPDDMKAFIDAAHGHGIMVLLDVVYNHFGPDGNYLSVLAPQFFHPERHTPWGGAIAYEKPPVRRFFLENALTWLDEFHLDGLRFDAIDQIRDPLSETGILVEIAERVRARFPERHIHLTTEDNRNITELHERDAEGNAVRLTGEWNDDFHNAAHVVATGEVDGYYEDFSDGPCRKLARALAEGFVYQGEPSRHAGGAPRGSPSAHLPPTAFIDFLQNHDQIGNRALGERLPLLSDEAMLRVLTAVHLLSPHVPLLFMGQEWGETRPFHFFTDFHGELADAVREGRRREFAGFGSFAGVDAADIPDPNAKATFEASKIDWSTPGSESGARWLAFTRDLLALRRKHVVPLLYAAGGNFGRMLDGDDGVVAVDWELCGTRLQLRANLAREERRAPPVVGSPIFAEPPDAAERMMGGRLAGPSMVLAIGEGRHAP